MFKPIKAKHANLLGSILPKNPSTPAAQGNADHCEAVEPGSKLINSEVLQ